MNRSNRLSSFSRRSFLATTATSLAAILPPPKTPLEIDLLARRAREFSLSERRHSVYSRGMVGGGKGRMPVDWGIGRIGPKVNVTGRGGGGGDIIE